jgi:hypothetical protein
MGGVNVAPWVRRWLWFAGLYVAAVVVLAVVAYGLRALLKTIVFAGGS